MSGCCGTGGQGLPLVTRGMLSPIRTIIQKFCIPLTFSVTRNIIKLNLSQPLPARINIKNSNISNLNIKVSQPNIYIKKSKVKINVKKICD